jgi:hypothetical protein
MKNRKQIKGQIKKANKTMGFHAVMGIPSGRIKTNSGKEIWVFKIYNPWTHVGGIC